MAIRREYRVCAVEELALGRTKSFPYGAGNGLAIRYPDGIKAFINRCTHMGGPVELIQKNGQPILQCKWHHAEFSPTTGAAIEGEAPQGTFLTPIELTERDGVLWAMWTAPDDPFAF